MGLTLQGLRNALTVVLEAVHEWNYEDRGYDHNECESCGWINKKHQKQGEEMGHLPGCKLREALDTVDAFQEGASLEQQVFVVVHQAYGKYGTNLDLIGAFTSLEKAQLKIDALEAKLREETFLQVDRASPTAVSYCGKQVAVTPGLYSVKSPVVLDAE